MRERLVLYAGARSVVMLNRYPYSSGHLMVAPRKHVASPELLERDERNTVADLIAASVANLRKAYKPAGINVGANLGRAAGASFADHMHWHLVPRWEGDTNFMTVLVSTRVLSQPLTETYALLEPLFKAIDPAAI
jgi:ATP adenylyltransferase